MSTGWGALSADRLHRTGESPSARPSLEADPEAGAWPEELEISAYAEDAMTLPGQGEPGKNCGQWYPQEFCDECGEPHLGVSRCEQRTCPNCWASWSRRRAEKITRRLGAARYAAEDGLGKRAVHAVVSPPEGSVTTLVDVQDAWRDAYGLAREKGVRGGVVVFHGFRVTQRGKAAYQAAVDGGDWDPSTDGRLWSFIRRREERVERGLLAKPWRGLAYWSPHWHILGLSRDFEADDPDEQEGWVARRVRSLEEFQLHTDDGYEDMVGAARYLLSHASFEADTSKKCIRWFGELHPSQFILEDELSDGALAVVERKAREVAAAGPERAEEGGEPDPCENCGSTSRSPIWEAGAALLDEGWCRRIGREQQRKLSAAFEWAIGDRLPPPGMKNPQSEEQAREVLDVLS